MKKISIFVILLTWFFSPQVEAKTEYIYRQGNNPANYVKVVKIGKSEAEELKLNQPYQFTEDKMADILRSMRYTRRALFSDKVKTRRVFEEETIEKYTPYLVKAFQEAGDRNMVYFSVAQKRPFYVVRDDKLTQVAMWVSGSDLHMRFDKTEAKLLGDYAARSPEGKKMRREAKGLRISLEPQEGQKFAFDSTQEVLVDINRNWTDIVIKIEDEEERLRKQLEYEKARGSKRERLKAEMKEEGTLPPSSTTAPTSTKDRQSAEARLTELKRLKDKGLISEKDYNAKKKEILENL